ncbi:hypothetical protein [Streptomyces sp. NPDC102370]|uniref:hypothetical protein n=1 Tax=Streptomyces sp. NPDC102370 TaxID=3366163 RepID=UPI0037F9DA45
MHTGRPSSMPPGNFQRAIRHDGTHDVALGAARDVFLDVTRDIALPTKTAPGLRLPSPFGLEPPSDRS